MRRVRGLVLLRPLRPLLPLYRLLQRVEPPEEQRLHAGQVGRQLPVPHLPLQLPVLLHHPLPRLRLRPNLPPPQQVILPPVRLLQLQLGLPPRLPIHVLQENRVYPGRVLDEYLRARVPVAGRLLGGRAREVGGGGGGGGGEVVEDVEVVVADGVARRGEAGRGRGRGQGREWEWGGGGEGERAGELEGGDGRLVMEAAPLARLDGG